MSFHLRRLILFLLALLIVPIFRLSTNYFQGQIEASVCEQFPLVLYHKESLKYDSELGAHDYSFALVAASGVYDYNLRELPNSKSENVNKTAKLINLVKFDHEWSKLNQPNFQSSWWQAGLYLDVFVRSKDEFYDYIVVFRGTDKVNKLLGMTDWFWGNLSYLTQSIPIPNQYDRAASAFSEIQNYAVKQAKGKKTRFLVIGHSLGGGLARHISNRFQCATAVFVNSSPVSNSHYFHWSNFKNDRVHIYDSNDILSSNARKILGEKCTGEYNRNEKKNCPSNYAAYEQNVISEKNSYLQHSALKMAVGALRKVAECQLRNNKRSKHPCMPYVKINEQNKKSRNLYCQSFGNKNINKLWNEGPELCSE